MMKLSLKGLLLSVFALTFLSAIAFAADPGSPIPTGATNDQQPASVLVYNFYSSDPADPAQDTKFTLTNISTSQSVAAHIFFIDGSNCLAADTFICLTENQTASFLASDVDPGVTGYMIAIASDNLTGVPIGFNFMIGDAHIKLNSGHEAKLNAEGFQALFQGPLETGDPILVTLDFNGVEYSKAARTLALDHIPSRVDGNRTMLVVNSLSGNLVVGVASIGNVFGILFDDAENAFSFTASATCQLNRILSDDFPITVPKLTSVITSGRSGWLKLLSTLDRGISGAAINFNRRSARERIAFNGGSNLHRLSNTTGTSILTIPVFPPTC
ncbi:MAG TPA: hypothetical protein VJ810_02605 [Blastocatellia bacterium]|nr:hypothetical protein [Blastocatellia bacterium]